MKQEQHRKTRPIQFGITTVSVWLIGTGLRIDKGQIVVLTDASNQPQRANQSLFARPRGCVWNTNLRQPSYATILLDAHEFVKITPQQKRAFLQCCKRWNTKPQSIQIEFAGVALMLNMGSIWLGIEPDGYTHS